MNADLYANMYTAGEKTFAMSFYLGVGWKSLR